MIYNEDKVQALFQHLETVEHVKLDENETLEDIIEEFPDEVYKHDGQEYLVLTDEEADKKAMKAAHDLVDDQISILPKECDFIKRHIDEDEWAEEIFNDSDRGDLISNGYEYSQEYDGVMYYIYEI